MTCERCQGNGEIVADWPRYMAGEDSVMDCPDCDGTGTLPPTYALDPSDSNQQSESNP